MSILYTDSNHLLSTNFTLQLLACNQPFLVLINGPLTSESDEKFLQGVCGLFALLSHFKLLSKDVWEIDEFCSHVIFP